MKKSVFLLVVLLTATLSASAQKMSSKQQEDAMLNLFARATLVNNKFAITREPITYYDYWAATGEKAHGPNTSVTNAAIVSDGKKQKMVNQSKENMIALIQFPILKKLKKFMFMVTMLVW